MQQPEHILDKLRADDQSALKYLFDKYHEGMVLFALKYLMRQDVAEEVVNDVFINLWNNRLKINIEKSVEAYLFTSVKNRSINYLKSKYGKVQFKEIDNSIIQFASTDGTNAVELDDLKQIIQKAVNKLPYRCKIIYNLSRNTELSNKEIAEKLEISQKTVESQLRNAVRRLKEVVEDQWHNADGRSFFIFFCSF